MYKKILVPLDGSKLAEAALHHASELAQLMNAELTLLRVITPPLYVESPNDPMYSAIMVEGLRTLQAEARDYLDRMVLSLRERGLTVSATAKNNSIVANTIFAHAEAAQADLIVMSTHGRSGLSRWLIGSVADKVVNGAKMPVLLIRPALEEVE